MDATMQIIILVVLTGIILWVLQKTRGKDGYMFLPTAYNPFRGEADAEFNDECLAYPGNQFCMMTDGTPGVCVQNGMCMPSMEVDLRVYRENVKLPSCTKPVFQEGCGRLCRCKELKGDVDPKDHMKCVKECKSWYSPIPTEFPI